MRLIDADKLYPDCLTKTGRLAISQSQIAEAPTIEERPQIMSCFNCKYDYKSAAEEPCKYCKGKHSEWQAKVEEAETDNGI